MPSSDKHHPERNEAVFTGERFIPHQTDPLLALEHYHRYCFASRFVTGKRVLDIACGEGYGSAFLSQRAGEVVGIDSDIDTINRARDKYSSIRNLIFANGRCQDVWSGQGSFDAIISFETLEHLDENDQQIFLSSVRQSLNSNGLFIVSSPDRDEYASAFEQKNRFHRYERTFSELDAFLRGYFKNVYLLAQRVLSFSAIWQLKGWREAQFQYYARKELFEEIPPDESFSPPLYVIAICTNEPVAEDILGKSNSFYFERSATDQTNEWLRWVTRQNAEAQRKRQIIADLQLQLEKRTRWAVDLEREIKERDERIEAVEKEFEERTKWVRNMEMEIDKRDKSILKLKQEFEERTRWALSLESEVAKERAYSKKLAHAMTSSFLYRALAKARILPRIYEL